MLEKELETAVTLARLAGAKINEFYKSGFTAEEKTGADNRSEPVTVADRTASEIIVSGLEKAFPEDGILSEEKPDTEHRLSKKRAWIIDPLDGTKGFINRNGDFAVQIGLAENGRGVLGVVYLPAEDSLYHAVRGSGTYLTENSGSPQRLRASDKDDFSSMDIAVSRDHRSSNMNRVIEDFGIRREVRRGSVGLKIGLIARRICDLYIHFSPRTKHWDCCAPEVIIEEAGGVMTDLFGGKIIYNTEDVLNHNGMVASCGPAAHEKTLKALKPLLNEFGRLRVI
ncbi:MAG: 3'(2'),5'-bisphosphate nucleotidase CysQ [Pyrinomonadaceae bacterium]